MSEEKFRRKCQFLDDKDGLLVASPATKEAIRPVVAEARRARKAEITLARLHVEKVRMWSDATIRWKDAEVALAAKDAEIAALRRGFDAMGQDGSAWAGMCDELDETKAEVIRSHDAICHLTGDNARLRGMIDYARGAPSLETAIAILTDALDGVTGADNAEVVRGERETLQAERDRLAFLLGRVIDERFGCDGTEPECDGCKLALEIKTALRGADEEAPQAAGGEKKP